VSASTEGRGSYRTGMGFAGLSFLAMAVLGVVSSVVIARIFGVRVVGEFALASAPAGSLWFLSSVKEQTALIRRLTALPPRDPRVTGLWSAVFAFSMGFTIVVAAVVTTISYFLFRGPIGHPELFGPVVASVVGYTFITNVGWNIDGIFAAFVAGRDLFWIRLHQTLALLAWYVAAGIVMDDVWGLVLATYLSAVSAVIHRLIAVRRLMRLRVPFAEVREGFRALPEIIRFGLRIAPGTIAQGLSNQSGTWMLGFLNTVSAVGAFNRAQSLTMRVQDLTSKITEMLFPTLVARRQAGDTRGFDRALVDTARYSLFVMVAVASVGGGGAFAIMDLFGPGFGAAAPAFAILALLPSLTTLAVIQSYALYSVDRPGVASLVMGGRLVVTLGTGYALTRTIGLEGPAIGLVAGAAFDVALKASIVRAYLSSPLRALWGRRQRLAMLLAYAAGFAAARGVHSAVPELAALPLTLGAGLAAYAGALVLAGGLNDRDRERGRSVLGALPWRSRPQTVAGGG
jgi:O-antigen/teichoic acid export membrane protein